MSCCCWILMILLLIWFMASLFVNSMYGCREYLDSKGIAYAISKGYGDYVDYPVMNYI